MKKLLGFSFAAIFFCSLASCTNETSQVDATSPETENFEGAFEQNGAIIPGKYIIQLNEGAVNTQLRARPTYEAKLEFVKDFAGEMLAEKKISRTSITKTYGKAIAGFAADLKASDVELLKNDPRVKSVEPDRIVSLGFSAQGNPNSGGSTAPAQTTPWGITRVGGAGNGVGKTAWIIDSGIDLTHPDLTVDVARSRTFLGGNTTPNDENGHGTHCAGTVAAKNNTIGVVGVAAGATVVSVRVLDRRGSGSNSGVIAGVDYVAANGANGDVANMSLGGGVSTALDNAVVAAAANGVKFCLAAGNESDNANNHSPARANGANIVTVSAMNSSSAWASFSNYGNPPIDWCAPGVSINSTWKGGAYNTISGTSMATPHVAGILLLGNITQDGTVSGDPDGNPDKIAHR